MKIGLRLILLMMVSGIVACQADESQTATGGGGAVEPAAPVVEESGAPPTTPPLIVHKGSTIQSSKEKPITVPDSDPAETAPIQVTEAPEQPFDICSPLIDTPKNDLPAIVSDPYTAPPPGSEARHHGVDFAYFRKFNRAAIEGAGVQVVMRGQVAAAVVDSFPYGNMVIIETPAAALPAEVASLIQIGEAESLYVLFAHLERPVAVRLGDVVEACQPLGMVGKTGNSGGAHLHMETRLGPSGTRFQAMAYYKAWATEEQRANYLLWRTSGTYRHFDPMLLFPQ